MHDINLQPVMTWLLSYSQGTVYLGGHGSEERMSVIPLHDEANGVISVMTCYDLHHEQILPQNVAYCKANQARYDAFAYDRLMNTTFGLVPGGRSPGTYRLGEVGCQSTQTKTIGHRLLGMRIYIARYKVNCR